MNITHTETSVTVLVVVKWEANNILKPETHCEIEEVSRLFRLILTAYLRHCFITFQAFPWN
jgi:hypothetical protein